MLRRLGLAGAAVLLAGAGLWGWSRGGDPGPPATGPRADSAAPAAVAAPAPTAAPPGLPSSLRGTDVAGGLVVDAEGRFVATLEALELFDYFLSALGEEPLERIRSRIEWEIGARLPPSAQPAALDLLDRYLGYRTALADLEAEGLEQEPLERRFQRLRELRLDWFDAREREAFFAAEEARLAVEIERLRVARDPELSEAERAERMAVLDEQLPPEVLETRAAARAAIELRRDEARLRAEGAGDAEIQALRERRFGPEAAARLADLDAQRAGWQARMSAWNAERAELLARGAGSEEIDAARAQRFADPEQLRARALEGR